LVVPTTDQIPNNSGPCWQLGQPLLGSGEVEPNFSGSCFSWAHPCCGPLDTQTHHHWVGRQSQAQ
jgi:hypothetical protein